MLSVKPLSGKPNPNEEILKYKFKDLILFRLVLIFLRVVITKLSSSYRERIIYSLTCGEKFRGVIIVTS